MSTHYNPEELVLSLGSKVLKALNTKMAVFWAVAPWQKITNLSEVLFAYIIRAMSHSEPEDSHFRFVSTPEFITGVLLPTDLYLQSTNTSPMRNIHTNKTHLENICILTRISFSSSKLLRIS